MFENRSKIAEELAELRRSYQPTADLLARNVGRAQCYFEGLQWILRGGVGARRDSNGTTRLLVDWGPDSRHILAQCNEVTRFVEHVAAATHPDRFIVEARAENAEQSSQHVAQVHENAVNAAVDRCNYLRAAQIAQFRRCVAGTWGMGLCVEGDGSITAYDFDPCQLTLEPSCQSPDLCQHPWVILSDSWTAERVERTYGVTLDPDKLKTMEQLEPMKMETWQLSGGRLFHHYAVYSRTKAARVHQIHLKDGGYRFGRMLVVIEPGDGPPIVPNWGDQSSPFGGRYGLPLILFHSHWRSDTMWSWGDVDQIRDEQDDLNLKKTLSFRIYQRYAHAQPLVDRRAFGPSAPSDDEIRRIFTNEIGAPILYNGSDRQRNVNTPALMVHPPPPAQLEDSIDRTRDRMREKLHRSDAHFGNIKTHQTADATARAMEAADTVLGIRVRHDVQAHDELIDVLRGTLAGLVRAGADGALRVLNDAGFDAMDFGTFARYDPSSSAYPVSVRESSVRYRGYNARKGDMQWSVTAGVMTAEQFAYALAKDLDSPLTDDYRHMLQEATKAALVVIEGAEWEPLPLGEWNTLFLRAFTLALFDRRAKADTLIRERLARAIEGQKMMGLRDSLIADPSLLDAGSSGGGLPETRLDGAAQPAGPISPADALEQLIGAA